MKKLSSIIALSLALALVLGMTAFADSESSDTENVVESLTEDVDAEVVETPSGAAAKATASDVVPAGVVASSATTLFTVELSGTVKSTVVIAAPGLKKADMESYTFRALHYSDAGEYLGWNPVTVFDGALQIEGITGYSTYTIVRYTKVTETGDEGEDEAAPAPGESPKTGETVPYAAVVALIALAGASVVGTKRAFAGR